MKKNTYIIAIIVILAITAFSFSIFLINKFAAQKKNQMAEKPAEATMQEVINQSLPKITCDFANDSAAQAKAIDEKNPEFCNCIKDNNTKDYCDKITFNVVYFQQAREQYDLAICQKISDTEMEKSCENIVKSGISELEKNNPELLAYLFSQKNNYNESAKLLNNALAKNPNDVKTILSLAMTYAGQAIAEHKESEYVPKAFNLVDQAIKLDPKNPEAYRIQGYVNEAKPDYYAALDSYNKSLELDSNYILSYVGRGHAYNMKGQLEEALADFKKAAELDKDKKYPEIYSNLCRLESSSPYIDDAIKNCKIVVSLPISNISTKAQAYEILGEMYIRAGRYEEAENQIKMALVVYPNDTNAHVLLAKLYNLENNYSSAEESSNKAINIDPSKSAAYSYLAQALLSESKLDDSIAAGLKGIDLVDKDVSLLLPNKVTVKKDIYNILAGAYGKKGDSKNEKKYQELANTIK